MVYDQSFATDELAAARSEAASSHPEHLASWNEQFTGAPKLNRCGHWAQIEHASEFNRLVSAFITA